MINLQGSCFLVVFVLHLVVSSGHQVYAVPYDYSFTSKCLAKPLAPHYSGGIVTNPELNEGLKGWTAFGDAKLVHAESRDGNKYIAASKRQESFHSLSQKFNLESTKLYTLSAWLQVSHGNTDIAAVFKTQSGYEVAGWVTARSGCWSMLKGGLAVNVSGPAALYFESKNTEVDIWADSISLQPFPQEEWKSHQHQSIEKARKRRLKLQVVDRQGRPVPNATVSIKQTRPHFPLGCAINQNILKNAAYQNWFTSRFKYTVFENELKWYSTERSWGSEDYSVSDALIRFAKAHGVAIRGHNVFWDDPRYQPSWLSGLSTNDLYAATDKRVTSAAGRYRGQLIHWDVVNENLHFSFYESKLGPKFSAIFYMKARAADRRVTPFLNDYNTIEESKDIASSPSNYLRKIRQLRKEGYNGPLGIGLEGHFTTPNLPYIRSALDTLASAQLPIWVTELDVASSPNQAAYLDQILREIHAHPAVQGIMIWSAWSPQGCYRMCLTDNNFRNLETGNVVDKILKEWGARASDFPATTDSNGFIEASLFHGEYEVKAIHTNGDQISNLQKLNVVPNKEGRDLLHFKIGV